MTFSIQNHQLINVDFIASPNCNNRPKYTEISLLVIHNISLPSGVFGGSEIENLFTNQLGCSAHVSFKPLEKLTVSAHVLIKRTGEVIQFVAFDKRAWHAGDSSFDSRSNCNNFSIGIELEGTDLIPYEEIQYQQLVAITNALMTCYPEITRHRIVGHQDIAPDRKTDPGEAFNWDYYFQLLG